MVIPLSYHISTENSIQKEKPASIIRPPVGGAKTDAGPTKLNGQDQRVKEAQILPDPRAKLLAEASEPPVAAPGIGVAADAHEALAAPEAKDGVTPPSFGILPTGAVGTVIRKGWLSCGTALS